MRRSNVDGDERVPLRIQGEELDAPGSCKGRQTVIYLLGGVKDLSKRQAARRNEDGPESQELCLRQASDGGKGEIGQDDVRRELPQALDGFGGPCQRLLSGEPV